MGRCVFFLLGPWHECCNIQNTCQPKRLLVTVTLYIGLHSVIYGHIGHGMMFAGCKGRAALGARSIMRNGRAHVARIVPRCEGCSSDNIESQRCENAARKRKAVRYVNERIHSAHRITTVGKGASERHNDKARFVPTGGHASVMPASAASHSSDNGSCLGCRLRQSMNGKAGWHVRCNGATCTSPIFSFSLAHRITPVSFA